MKRPIPYQICSRNWSRGWLSGTYYHQHASLTVVLSTYMRKAIAYLHISITMISPDLFQQFHCYPSVPYCLVQIWKLLGLGSSKGLFLSLCQLGKLDFHINTSWEEFRWMDLYGHFNVVGSVHRSHYKSMDDLLVNQIFSSSIYLYLSKSLESNLAF